MNIQVDGLSTGYDTIVSRVLEKGTKMTPRLLETLDLGHVGITIVNPRDRLVVAEWRDMNVAFAFTEWLMLMIGDDELERIAWYAQNMRQFSTDGVTVDGAYGPRVAPHLGKLIGRMWEDKETRHGVITILKTEDFDKPNPPCTISVQARNIWSPESYAYELDWATTMRSNDAIWGFTYDAFFWTMTQEWLALSVGSRLGQYHHNADSLHIYTERDRLMLAARSWSFQERSAMPSMMDASYEQIARLSAIETAARIGLFDYAVTAMKTLEPYWQMWACVLIAWSAKKWKDDVLARESAAQIQFVPLRKLVERRL